MTGRKKSDIILMKEPVGGDEVDVVDEESSIKKKSGSIGEGKQISPYILKRPLTSYKIKLTLWTIVLFSSLSFPFHYCPFHSSNFQSQSSAEQFHSVMSISTIHRFQPRLRVCRNCPTRYLLGKVELLESQCVVLSAGELIGWWGCVFRVGLST